ncbi:MAG: hypothetical protein ACTHXJ_04970 [Mesonia sp.]
MDQLKIAGGPKATSESLYYFDSQIGKREDETELARDASSNHPL